MTTQGYCEDSRQLLAQAWIELAAGERRFRYEECDYGVHQGSTIGPVCVLGRHTARPGG